MYYVIEGVRWGADGHISHVRWHGVDTDGDGLRHTPSTLVPVVDAAEVCKSSEVRVFVDGDTGQFFRMKACPEGIDAVTDDRGTTLQQRMAHLPAI
jgi:hypothetical protein